MKYDFSTAQAICNDSRKNTWEVRARGTDGKWWTVSESSEMSFDFAVHLAADMQTHPE